ncbi:MAG: hypothetical protein ACAH83_03635 [Alphaproteobacteria bacterium]
MTAPPETNRRRGAPCGNRNALKSGRYTAEAKAERKRKRLLLRQLRAGLAYARSVVRARAAAENLFHISLPAPAGRKNFQKSKNNSRKAGAGSKPFAYAGIPGDAIEIRGHTPKLKIIKFRALNPAARDDIYHSCVL